MIYLTLLATSVTRHDISRKIALRIKFKRKETLQSTTRKIRTNIVETTTTNTGRITNTDHIKGIVYKYYKKKAYAATWDDSSVGQYMEQPTEL